MKWVAILVHVSLCALYMGNPAGPEMTEYGVLIPRESPFGVEVGFAQNWSFDRPMKLAEEAEPDERARLNDFSYDAQVGFLTANFADRVTAYGGFGAMKVKLARRPLPENEISYDSSRDFTWKVGGQAVLFFVDRWTVGVSGSYLSTKPSVETITQNGANIDPEGSLLSYNEWQVGLGCSGRFQWFVPYLGLAFASADLSLTNPRDMTPLALQVRNEDFKSYDRLTVVMGLGISNETIWYGNVEGRLIGETGLTLSFNFRF